MTRITVALCRPRTIDVDGWKGGGDEGRPSEIPLACGASSKGLDRRSRLGGVWHPRAAARKIPAVGFILAFSPFCAGIVLAKNLEPAFFLTIKRRRDCLDSGAFNKG